MKPPHRPHGGPKPAGGTRGPGQPPRGAWTKRGPAPDPRAPDQRADPNRAPRRDPPDPDRRPDAPRPQPSSRLQTAWRPREPERPRDSHRGPPPAPAGAVWLYGQHAVAAALVNPARHLRRLLATEEAEADLLTRVPRPWPLAAERMERPRIGQLLGRDAVHQGLALLADPLAAPQLALVLDRPGPVLVLDQVSDPRNVGAILRSAAAFGAAGVIAQDRNAPEETGSLAKAASGALETVPLLRAVNIARTLVALKAADRWVIGLDAAGTEKLSGAALAGRKLVLVLGAEGQGLRRLTRETCDILAKLAMPGSMESLNVSAAAAIALYETTRLP